MKAQGIPEDRLELLKGVSGAFRPGVLTALMGVVKPLLWMFWLPKKQETFARISGYCEQTDIHSPHVTVYESLQYSAWLRLSPDVDASSRKGCQVSAVYRLSNVKGLQSQLSLCLTHQSFLWIDARAAAIVMRTMKNTVDTWRLVVCTIHQSTTDIFEAFNEEK